MNIRGPFSKFWSAAREIVLNFIGDQPFQLAAALSFYVLLSLAPMLLVIVGVASLVYGQAAAQGELVGRIEGFVGLEAARVVQDILAQAQSLGGGGISLAIGLVTLLVGATTVFAQFQNSLNQIWGVEASPKTSHAIWAFLRTRLLALAAVLLIGLLLVASVIASSILAGLEGQIDDWVPGMGLTSRILDLLLTLAVVTALIAVLFKYLPDVSIRWQDVWIGAAVIGVLFGIGKYAIGAYLGRAGVGSAYGAAGSLVVLLVWVYYSALIVFFGAEITQTYARRRGSGIQPASYARRVTRKAEENEQSPDQPT